MPTALIVEDEPEANRLLAMLVQLRGYRTSSAFTGGEALEKVRDELPDIVFLDLMLPDINGYEVCKCLKAGPRTSLTPVVMVTARVEAANRKECFRLGADEYIPKPYTPDQIFRAMADADNWRQHLQRDRSEGVIHLQAKSDEPLRQLARLRNLLIARTPLGLESVCLIVDALREIWASAEAWGGAHRVNTIATLTYRLDDAQLSFTLRDLSGWLGQNRLTPEARWPASLAAARFDEYHITDDGQTLTLLRRYP